MADAEILKGTHMFQNGTYGKMTCKFIDEIANTKHSFEYTVADFDSASPKATFKLDNKILLMPEDMPL